jgi:hypothetical protein
MSAHSMNGLASPAPMAEPRQVAGTSSPAPDFFIPPHPAGVMELLRRRGHVVTARRNKHGSVRYRIDGGRELQAIEMDRYYLRTYDMVMERAE